jgi:NADH dehydrogenase/NADH:ubiquinone oxidoreductase subunit G
MHTELKQEVTVTINGKKVTATTDLTVLEVARQMG